MIQEYHLYKESDFEVWKILFERQISNVQQHAVSSFCESLEEIGFTSSRIPDYNEVNRILMEKTGWQIQVVPNIVPIHDFFEMLATKHFPATTWLRSMAQLDYLNEPDMFHDCFGHMPMLMNKEYTHFLENLTSIAMKYLKDAKALELLGRLYWFTIEFGLVKEDGREKILGAGLISSYGEAMQSLDASKATHIPFHIEEVLKTSYINSSMQLRYFVLKGMDQLYASTLTLEADMLSILHSDYDVEVSLTVM